MLNDAIIIYLDDNLIHNKVVASYHKALYTIF